MPPVNRILCLANSRKHGAYCFAGINLDTGTWVRPVSQLSDGRVERSTMLIDNRMPKPGDIVEIPLADSGPDFGFECENRTIREGMWRIIDVLQPRRILPFCTSQRMILHNGEKNVSLQYMQSLPADQRQTLQLVEAFEFEAFSTGLSAQGGHKWNGSFVSQSGERLTTRITDPVLLEKLEQGYIPGAHAIITVSLSMPFVPEADQSQGPACWKLIAGFIELQPGIRPTTSAQRVSASYLLPLHTVTIPDETVATALKNIFGFDRFKPNQQQIVRAILDGRDCFASMPTGGGKSLCYQLPAYLMRGTCLVISPLIALMKDQVDAATQIGLRAAALTSAQTETQRIGVFKRLMAEELDLLYVSPERVALEAFFTNLKRVPLCLIAIDEAHCISEWGHDFRPDYLLLSQITTHFPGVAIAAFTATATHRVQQDIIRRLELRNPLCIRASFNRPNLFYEVQPKTNIDEQIISFIRSRPAQAGIVYRTSRSSVDATAETLCAAGIRALAYHAGLDNGSRQGNQEAFRRDEIDIVVATIAFGMGIDKPNIRFVVHGDLPKNIEAYYQETGRAGRDGEPAHCMLFYSRGDIPKIRHFITQVENDRERRRLQASLNEMVLYAGNSAVCRRRKILAYFGEETPERSCGGCDVCMSATSQVDITTEGQMLLSAVVRTGQRFGAGHIIDIVTGAATKKIRQFNHDRLFTYGVGKGRSKRQWQQIIDDLLAANILTQSDGQYPVLCLTDDSQAVLKGTKSLLVRRKQEIVAPVAAIPVYKDDPGLFEHLRALRLQLARDHKVPPYIIFADRTLHELARQKPSNHQELGSIYGIGETKRAAFGAAFLKAIAEYLGTELTVDTRCSPPLSPPPVRTISVTTILSQTIEATWRLVQQGFNPDEIAQQRSLRTTTIIEHIERLILGGRKVPIDKLVPAIILDHVRHLVPELKTGLLRELMDAATIPLSYDQARLARAWVLVENTAMANPHHPKPLPVLKEDVFDNY
jgi:ATP-dependent DNA helicase RecQ